MPARVIEGYEFPEGLWYHPREHLWLRPEEGGREAGLEVTVGVDAIGVEALGEVVYVQLVEPGLTVRAGQAVGSLEAEKMVRPVVAPVSGRLVGVNAELPGTPRLLNLDPYGRGWLMRIVPAQWPAKAHALLHEAGDVLAWVRDEVRAHEDRR